MTKKKDNSIANNKRAFHDYEIIDKYETGIVLQGCEVKSIRDSKVSIKESYVKIFKGECWLLGCHINNYPQAASYTHQSPTRDRKLLLHKREIEKIAKKVDEKGMTIVPLNLYIKKNKVKVQIGVARAKKLHDKRNAQKEKDAKREMDRGMSNRY